MATNEKTIDKPNGPVAAALLAGGIGAAVLGIATLLADVSASIKTALTRSTPVGALSGVTSVAVIAFVLSWIILNYLYRGKEVNFSRFAIIAFILLAIGLVFTFPPVLGLFA